MFNRITHDVTYSDAIRPSLAMRPCIAAGAHGEDCYSIFQAGTDFCLHSHITYAKAYQLVYGRFPEEELSLEELQDQQGGQINYGNTVTFPDSLKEP